MTTVRILWLLLCLYCIAAEIRLARKTRNRNHDITDKEECSEWILWITLSFSLVLGLILKTLAFAPIPIEYLKRQLLALVVIIIGLSLRYTAVNRLGRFFTTQVSIQNGHRLIVGGPYRYVRHPAYTGLLMAFSGAGLAMGDFLALLILTIPTLIAFNYRIAIEEKLLLKKFGRGYQHYCKTTGKLFPWLINRN